MRYSQGQRGNADDEMNLTDNEKAVIFNEGWEPGFAMLCKRYADSARSALAVVDPTDACTVKEHQVRLAIFSKELPKLKEQMDEFRAAQAQAMGKP